MQQTAHTKFSEERKFAFDTSKVGMERGLSEEKHLHDEGYNILTSVT